MTPRLPFTTRDVTGALWSLVSTAVGLGLAIWIVPGVRVTHLWALPLAALAVATGDVLLRPVLRRLARLAGVLGALVSGVAAQLVVAWLALTYLPGFSSRGWGDVALVLVLAAVFMAAGRWVVGASDNDYVVDDLLRRAHRSARRAARSSAGRSARSGRRTRAGAVTGAGTETGAETGGGAPGPAEAGLLVVQLDGVSRATLEYALQAGLAPTLARWLGSGRHRLESWWAQVPATTPASQAGLLHGTSRAVPAFRWWDRDAGRLVVTNDPADAAAIEERLSDGEGLLAGGGVAVSTMFSGDATTSLLVMSRARAGVGPGQMFVHFFSSPFVLVRALVSTVAELLKELYQGWQQALRDVEPRVRRLGWYPLLRAVTNVVLRDLNTSLVAEQLVRGAPVVFVDLVDYDEIAHHAGPLRPESLRSLEGLDRVVGLFEQVAAVSPRRYEIVVLSDHGQSLGPTFEQVVGRTFLAEVRRLMALPEQVPGRVPAAGGHRADDTEQWGAVNTALNAFGRSADARVLVGPDRTATEGGAHDAGRSGGARGPLPTASDARGEAQDLPEVAVVGSGNLGLVWFPRSPVPLTGAQVRERWPALLPGLVTNPAVGVVVTREGPVPGEGTQEVPDVVAHGRVGSRSLVTGRVEGADPLAGLGPRAADDLLRAAGLENSGDLLLVSSVDETGMVHAFEGLVGSHGGLGGAQNEAILVRPAGLEVPDGERQDVGGRRMLVGSESVHARLVAWLRELGLRP